MQRVVIIQGKAFSLSAYVAGWRKALALPSDAEITGFNWFSESKAETLRHFRRGLHDRINRRIDGFGHTLRPVQPRGRKECYEWQVETRRAAQALNTPRLAIHWLPPWLRNRFAHKLSDAY
jgi:hypothetical protein